MRKYKVVISRSETIDLIGLAQGVPAKIDTGAFRSAIHASDVKIVKKNGQDVLTCNLLGHGASMGKAKSGLSFETAEFNQVLITNSFGHQESRYEVQLRVKLGPKIFNTSFTLANRSKNFFPILVGRQMLKDRFIVDVSTTSLSRPMLDRMLAVNQLVSEETE